VATKQAVDLKGSAQETIKALLSALPPRIWLKRNDDRTGQLKAAEFNVRSNPNWFGQSGTQIEHG
jgi:hypothetical protein